MKPKIAIINVSEPNAYPQIFRRFVGIENLVLPVLAALTPPEYALELVDESVYVRKPDYRRLRADLAALSFRTGCANRAYAIADLLRSRGIPVVLGGIHCSALPEESARHADSVVIGEAEPVWAQVLEDFRRGTLKPVYRAAWETPAEDFCLPRRDVLRYPNRALISFSTIQTSRGCPHRCRFCSLAALHGGRYRPRPVDRVVEELAAAGRGGSLARRAVSALERRLLFFYDDNLFANRPRTLDLFRRLAPLGKRWYAQAPISAADDDELLKAARDSGCRMLSIGFDSVSRESLKGARKQFNDPSRFGAAAARIHAAGILVGGNFILGFDEDDETVFERTHRHILDSGIDLVSFHILTPYPGTPFFTQIMQEGRLHADPGDWRLFDTHHVVFRPRQMSPETLQAGYHWLWREFTSIRSIRQRARFTPRGRYYWPLNLFLHALARRSFGNA